MSLNLILVLLLLFIFFLHRNPRYTIPYNEVFLHSEQQVDTREWTVPAPEVYPQPRRVASLPHNNSTPSAACQAYERHTSELLWTKVHDRNR